MNDASTLWTVAFSAALLLGVLTKLYLNGRQVRHVAQHRSSVPQAFADRISLDAHQKAADYTLAKSRLATIDLAWSTAVLLGWTLLGGLSLLDQWINSSSLAQTSPLLRPSSDLGCIWCRCFSFNDVACFGRCCMASDS